MNDRYLEERLPLMFDVCYELLKLDGQTVHFKQKSIKSAADVRSLPDYNSHKIRVNPLNCGEEYDVLQTVLHECIHVKLAGYMTVMSVARKMLSKKEKKVLNRLYTHVDENITVQMEQVFIEAAWTMYIDKLKENNLDMPEGVEDDEDDAE